MKSIAFIATIFLAGIAAVGLARAADLQVCAPVMNVEQAHRNLVMAVCNQMLPGFINNMDIGSARMKRHHHDDDEDDNEGEEEEVEQVNRPVQFPPFPPFPPYPAFPPYPPFPPFPPTT